MQIDLGSLFGMGQPFMQPEAPDWLKEQPVCPVLIGKELWWHVPGLVVKGVPPIGTVYKHAWPHELPEGIGPGGRGRQVFPGARHMYGYVELRDQSGVAVARYSEERLTFLEGLAMGQTLLMFYPWLDENDKDGFDQIAVFEMNHAMTHEIEEVEEEKRAGAIIRPNAALGDQIYLPEVVAFARIYDHVEPKHYLSADEIDILPKFRDAALMANLE